MEDRNSYADTHLAMLGVKRGNRHFGYYLRIEAAFDAASFFLLREDYDLKTRYKIIIITAAVLAILGVTGTVLIRYLFFRDTSIPELIETKEYYTKGEAEYLIRLLLEEDDTEGDGRYGSEAGNYAPKTEIFDSEAGFTVSDAKAALQRTLAMDEGRLNEWLGSENEAGQELQFLTEKKDTYVLGIEEFRGLYEYMISQMDDPAVKVENLIVLELPEWVVSDGEITEQQTAQSQMSGEQGEKEDANLTYHVVSPEATYTISAYTQAKQELIYQQIADNEDPIVRVYVCQDRILEYTGTGDRAVTMNNVWLEGITTEDDPTLQVFVHGYHKMYPCRLPDDMQLSDSQGILADLVLEQGNVTDIVLKSDIISSKVLAVAEDGVELDNYGLLKLSDHYKIYKIYGELAVEPTSRILVGYNTTNFVIADGVIEAALITEPIKAENIRVVIRNSDYSSLTHESVVITSEDPFTVYFHDQEKSFEAGEEVTFTYSNGYMADGRVFVRSNVENGTLRILSIKRNQEPPAYRGTIEVAPYGEDQLIIVNELTLEEYLYAVVPSEMPVSYGDVPLQVQAICARGYAYRKMQDGTYAKYGAHLDDSTMTQVYHSVDETEESILAVKETYGLVPVYDSEVIQAYFFSTSCGVTCNNADVWDGEALPYLKDQLEGIDLEMDASDFAEVQGIADIRQTVPVDLSSEELFQAFIDDDTGYDIYEKEFPFYRWTIEYSPDEMTEAVNSTLASRYEAAPDKILTLQSDGSFYSQPVTDIGDIRNVTVTKRGVSGIVKELELEGSKATIRVIGQTNARALMAPYRVAIQRQDGAESIQWSMIPSPFYYVERNADGYYVIHGGGFGHGVGMSQNGAKALADRGYDAEAIVQHYYDGVELVNIYR